MALALPTSPLRTAPHRYLRPPAPLTFPCDQPESERVPENRRHFELRTLLFQFLQLAFGERAVIGSDQYVYWDPTNPRKCCAPDVMLRLGEPDAPFDSWKVWERGAPHLAIEVTSPSDKDHGAFRAKLEHYRQLGVRELVRFDRESREQPLRIWDGSDGDLVERDHADPHFSHCDTLDAYWCVKPHAVFGQALRLSRDAAGTDLFPSMDELRQQAEREREQAEREREQAERRIRELEAELARRSSG